jgi:hypothetical protein
VQIVKNLEKRSKGRKVSKASKENQGSNPVNLVMHSPYKKCILIQKKVPQKKDYQESEKSKLKI